MMILHSSIIFFSLIGCLTRCTSFLLSNNNNNGPSITTQKSSQQNQYYLNYNNVIDTNTQYQQKQQRRQKIYIKSSFKENMDVFKQDGNYFWNSYMSRNTGKDNLVYGTSSLYNTTDLDNEVDDGFDDNLKNERRTILRALKKMEKDMQFLDNVAGESNQISPTEAALLFASAFSAFVSPIIFSDSYEITKLVAPAAAAISASVGITSEYIGKVAVADSKEIAASAIICAAEAEGFLANAERSKAILPLCVGIGACSASLALLAPTLLEEVTANFLSPIGSELFLIFPLVSVLSAAVSGLANQETKTYCDRAISIGNRRFASNLSVGRTWLSTTEQITRNSDRLSERWYSFAINVLPAPILGALAPGSFASKTTFVAALAACQSAWILTTSERYLARASDAVALKARSAAVCDTYANQGARNAALLPFTSALSSLCTAATAAVVELPLLNDLAIIPSTFNTIALQVILISFFPALSSLLAGGAGISRARSKVDTEACRAAATTLALPYEDKGSNDDKKIDPVIRPLRAVVRLVSLTLINFYKSLVRKKGKILSSIFDRNGGKKKKK